MSQQPQTFTPAQIYIANFPVDRWETELVAITRAQDDDPEILEVFGSKDNMAQLLSSHFRGLKGKFGNHYERQYDTYNQNVDRASQFWQRLLA